MDRDLAECNSSYIPTSAQYFAALGSFSSSVLIIGTLVTIGLFILFVEQVVYTNQTAHHGAKRHIYWIASVFPMMTLMSLVAMAIPRAHNVCLSVKMVYMSIGISHFTDLTLVMFGGEELLLERAGDDAFNLQVNPLCCCCRCLPRPPVTKYSLRLVVLLTDQLPFAQAVYYVIVLILLAADNITLGDIEPSNAFLWLNLFKLTSALFGVYGFMILSSFSRGYLDDFKYRKKSRSIRFLLIITNFQSMILSILANYGVFPCLPLYVSPTVYKQTVDNSLYLLEMMILGPYTFWQYHDQMFSTPITTLPFFRNTTRSISISPSMKDDHSTTGTVSTTVTAIAEHSGSSDDEDSKGRSNSSSSKDSMRENSAIVDIVTEREESTAVIQVNSRDSSIRESKSRSGKNISTGDRAIASNDSIRDSAIASNDSIRDSAIASNDSIRDSAIASNDSIRDSAIASNDSIRDSVSDSSRKGRKSNVRSSRNINKEHSGGSNRHSGGQDSAVRDSGRASKHKSKRSTPVTPSTSQSTTRENSDSPSNTNTSTSSANPTHNTSAQAPSLLERARSLVPHSTKSKAEYVRF